jgi:hypothetical protein
MLNADEMEEAKKQMNICAVAMAKTMFQHSERAHVGLLAAIKVAAGSARAVGLDKHAAMDLFLTYYNDATNFIAEE